MFSGTSVALTAGVRELRNTCGAAVVNENVNGAAMGTPPRFVAPLAVTVNVVDGVSSAIDLSIGRCWDPVVIHFCVIDSFRV